MFRETPIQLMAFPKVLLSGNWACLRSLKNLAVVFINLKYAPWFH